MKKLTQQQLQEVLDLNNTKNQITQQLGQIELQKLQLSNTKQELLELYKQLIEQEKLLGEQLQEEYGEGTINIETGEFTPSS
jgi:hypothetical protein